MEKEGRLDARALRMVCRGMFSTESGWTGLRRALKDAAGVLRKAGADGTVESEGECEDEGEDEGEDENENEGEDEEGGGGEEAELKCSAGEDEGFEREETGHSDATVPLDADVDRTKDAPAPVDDMVGKVAVINFPQFNQLLQLDDEFYYFGESVQPGRGSTVLEEGAWRVCVQGEDRAGKAQGPG